MTRRGAAAAVLAAVAAGACASPARQPIARDFQAPVSSCKEVVYYVDGSTPGGADITYQNSTGGVSQAQDRAVPLTRKSGGPGIKVGCMRPGGFVDISAQNQADSGTITCRIEADGVVVAGSQSDGAYAIATCDGTVPE